MITVCCFLWHDPAAQRRHVYSYGVRHVRTLRSMVARHLQQPHRFVCVTDRAGLFAVDRGIETVPLAPATHLPGTRYAKLMLFRRNIAELLGERILYLDLDTVITASIDPLVDRDEDLVLWRNPNFGAPRRARYNTSMILLRAGTRPELVEAFDPHKHPAQLAKEWGGTDQAWISTRVAPDEAHWTDADGVYGAGRLHDIVPGVGTRLPENARIVFTPGAREPSMPATQALHPWIKEHYR